MGGRRTGKLGDWRATALLCGAAAVPFAPGAGQFFQRGLPDILYTGDGAALELGTLHAARGLQLLGPYSRFGWSHPGPTFFYLAAPIYELFGRRAPALNLFTLAAQYACAIGIVLIAARLRDALFALAVSALVAVYALVGLPFLLANEWNPLFPILPLVLLSFIALDFARGRRWPVPLFAFVASLIVQTHIAYTPEVLATLVFALVSRRSRAKRLPVETIGSGIWLATAGILAACWMLPIYQEIVERPGNIELIVRFFVPKNWAEHTWSVAFSTVVEQLTVMPLAVVRTFHVANAGPKTAWIVGLALAQPLGVVVVRLSTNDDDLKSLANLVLIQFVVAILAVRAIRGEIELYLVAWISLVGLLSWGVAAAWLTTTLPLVFGVLAGRIIVSSGAGILLGLALAAPVAHGAVFHERDPDAERIARDVAAYLRTASVERPTIQIAARETWPTAAAVVLYLYKHGTPISVEDEWLTVVGRTFKAPAGEHPTLIFDDAAVNAESRRGGATLVTRSGTVSVYVTATRALRSPT